MDDAGGAGVIRGCRSERYRGACRRLYAAVVAPRPTSSRMLLLRLCLLVVWRSLEGLGADPLPWLYAVARRTLANSLRAQLGQAAPGARLAAQQASVADEIPYWWRFPSRFAALCLGWASVELEVVLLVAWEELSPREAAVAAGCSGVAFRARPPPRTPRAGRPNKSGRGAVVQPRASASEERALGRE